MSAILVFARAPEPGRTKTRLIPALGAEGAARLHAELLRHTVAEAAAAGAGRVELWYTGADRDGMLAAVAAEHGVGLQRQSGDDLGERMAAALTSALDRGGPALVIGSDCPALDSAAIAAALAALEVHDAVLGPARDGGYVLLGVQRVAPALFADIPWGTERVLAVTRLRLSMLGWSWLEQEPRDDLDRPEDLERLRAGGGFWAGLVSQY